MRLWLAVSAVLCLAFVALADDAAYQPKIAPASDEGQKAIAGFRIPQGLRIKLLAAEPLLANPVAFCLDERGRIYVAETYRQGNAVTDNRDRMYWLDDDLAAMTVADRLAYHQKHLKEKLQDFTKEHDRIRLLEDRDSDGTYEHSSVFTTGYNSPVEGTGAGVLARRGDVYYTNIPKLWKLRDTNADGTADESHVLHDGYGVRVAFRGHDLHGLRFGPDGRLYFSIGDRGFNVTTPHRQYVYPEQGAVLRCEPDGSNLEVVHTGLRNPQELAFDQYGQLFTGDNNSDSGDKARWVSVVEGGDSGWRMSFQYLSDRGPWNREKMWHPAWEGQPSFLVPPITNFADGPSGLTYDPGIGLPEKYRDHFFLCDFRGGPVNSGIRSFAVKPKGASFELVDAEEFAWNILATDADFGPDGSLYIADWVDGWNGAGKGRMYRIVNPATIDSDVAKQARTLMAEGFTQRPIAELKALLDHPSQQVRQEAQFALAERGAEATGVFAEVLCESGANGATRLARLHALWGLGQIARTTSPVSAALQPMVDVLKDADAHVRRVAVQVLGDVAGRKEVWQPDPATLLPSLKDESPHVRFHATISAGKLLGPAAVPALLDLLEQNADADPYLRHAGVMGLYYACNSERDVLREPRFDAAPLAAAMAHSSPAVRLAAVLVLRRYARPEVAMFLGDTDPRVVEEAARAIHDVLIPEAVPALAELANRSNLSEPTAWRVISANFRLGTPEAAKRIATLIARKETPEAIRLEGLRALGDWAKPSGRDRVLGLWRPLPERDAASAVAALRTDIASLFNGSEGLRKSAIEIAGRLGLKEIGPELYRLVQDAKQEAGTRVKALNALDALRDQKVADAVDLALESDQPELRAMARRVLARTQPQAALELLKEVLDAGEIVEQQAAFATLGNLKDTQAEAMLAEWLAKLKSGGVKPELHLELLEASRQQNTDGLKSLLSEIDAARKPDAVSQFQESLAGGNAETGRTLFFEKTSLSCVRCHKVGGQGGEVGPDLSSIGLQQKRDYLLASMADPNKDIAKGFETVKIATVDGLVHTGIVKNDDGTTLTLITAEAKLIAIKKDDIEDQARGKSAMPEDLIRKMSRRELRDLVEFLAQQTAKPKEK